MFLILALLAASAVAGRSPSGAGAAPVGAAELVIDDFAKAPPGALPPGWRSMKFRKIPRATDYSIARDGDDAYLVARASASASGLLKPMPKTSAREWPVLTWRWRIGGVVKNADARSKQGDDYAARVYVAFESRLFGARLPSNAINYVWDNRLPVETTLPNAYTAKVRMIVVESGDGKAGTWVEERRDLLADYRALFGGEPPPIAFIAVMSDTDQTGETVEAAFDDLVLRGE